MSSSYVAMYTHGFIYGYFKNINNKYLKKTAIENYKNRMSTNKKKKKKHIFLIINFINNNFIIINFF